MWDTATAATLGTAVGGPVGGAIGGAIGGTVDLGFLLWKLMNKNRHAENLKPNDATGTGGSFPYHHPDGTPFTEDEINAINDQYQYADFTGGPEMNPTSFTSRGTPIPQPGQNLSLGGAVKTGLGNFGNFGSVPKTVTPPFTSSGTTPPGTDGGTGGGTGGGGVDWAGIATGVLNAATGGQKKGSGGGDGSGGGGGGGNDPSSIMSWLLPLILFGGQAGASLYGMNTQGDAIKEAAKLNAEGVDKALGLQEKMWKQGRDDMMPFYKTGVNANMTLSDAMGMDRTASGIPADRAMPMFRRPGSSTNPSLAPYSGPFKLKGAVA